jgi:ribonucleoside-triphosphate reductase
LEAPFHEYCNAGAISYVELNGNARSNPSAFIKIIKYALEQQVSYFSINHPIDRCSSCGYEGVIGTNCPSCNAHENDVRFHAAKQAEVRDRVKHL